MEKLRRRPRNRTGPTRPSRGDTQAQTGLEIRVRVGLRIQWEFLRGKGAREFVRSPRSSRGGLLLETVGGDTDDRVGPRSRSCGVRSALGEVKEAEELSARDTVKTIMFMSFLRIHW